MSDRIIVKSRSGDYEVNFIDDFAKSMRLNTKAGDFLIIDKKINGLYYKNIRNIFAEGNIVVIQADEHSKTLEKCYGLVRGLINKKIRKNNRLFALGGGIIQDITGFIASIIFRGIEWVFYPTTLLAQADSCIGSKTSINVGKYKNLLGSFYPPSRIFIDMGFLRTLPSDEIKSGIGEILHFYFIAGKDEQAKKMMANYEKFLKSPQMLKDHIISSLKIKKPVVEMDEFDKNQRNIFNYGHTFAHAIETITSYGINHGQAVTIGMDLSNYISMHFGYINKETFEYMHSILKRNISELKLTNNDIEGYFKVLLKDKKNIDKDLTCILTKGPGSMFKSKLPLDKRLKGIIISYFKNERTH